MQDILLSTQNLTRYFGKRKVLDQVNLTLHRGDIYGLLGGNGAGKTTLFKLIVGLLWPHDGLITLFNQNIHPLKRDGLSRVGSIIGTPSFYSFLSARENLEMIGSLRGNGCAQKTDDILKIVGLEKRAQDKVSTYSDGMKQRLAIAQALAGDTTLLILDEPFRGLDPVGVQDIWKILITLNQTRSMTILFSSHNVAIAQKHCNRIGIIHRGKLLYEGDKTPLLNSHDSLETAYLSLVGNVSSIEA